jgi:DNA-binding YbaB/EbfC family protein
MKGGLGNILRQAQKMQAQMQKVQEELAHKTVEASSGGGMVKAVVNGRQELISIVIEPEVVNPSDVEMLQDLVVAAVNEALKRSQALAAEEMGKLTSGLNVPGLGGLL